MSPHRKVDEPEPDPALDDEPDENEDTDDDGEEIDLDAIIKEQVQAALAEAKDSVPDGEGGTDDTGGGTAAGEGSKDSGASTASLTGDSGNIEDRIERVLDKRKAAETLEERLARLENPPGPEPRKRKGLAKVLLGDGWSFKR